MIIKPYNQWRDEMLSATDDETGEPTEIEVNCPACKGEGVKSCDCDCPNCTFEAECTLCCGTGKISSNDLAPGEGDQVFTRHMYVEAVLVELSALAEWIGKPVMAVVIEAGFAPYYHIGGKEPKLHLNDLEEPHRATYRAEDFTRVTLQ